MNSRIKDLDGLRGVAVLIVIALHVFKRAGYFTANPVLLFIASLTSVGWVGVDIFFTLSGFLITSILLHVKNEPNYFKNFYMRRALRIIPLYLILIAFVVFFVPRVEQAFKSQLTSILPIMLLYQQNWITIFSHLYMTPYLGVTWSLAIEEQFYVLWPFLVYYLNTEKLIKFSTWVIVISFFLRVAGVLFWGNIAEVSNFFYYNSFTRFEQIITGGLLALLLARNDETGQIKERIYRFSVPVFWGFLLIFVVLCLMSLPGVPHPGYSSIPLTIGGYTSAAFFSAALIGVFVTHSEKNMLRRFFQNSILVSFGKYSYSMYLFHVPAALILLDVFWRKGMRGWWAYLLYIVTVYIVTILVSLLTWNVFEKHILGLKKYFDN